jgi:hypothetical protein
MIYSSFISEKVTETQRRKFFGSMESTDETGLSSKVSTTRRLGNKLILPLPKPWTNIALSSSTFQPGPDGKSYPETDTFISFIGALASRPIRAMIMHHSTTFNNVVPVRVMSSMVREGAAEMKYSVSPVNLCVGKISYIQEPGLKLRAVANPNRVLQAALDPLKKGLGHVLESLPNDHTFNQERGVAVVQQWLQEQRTCHSIDLSDATNLFPLSYTLSVLKNRIKVSESSDKDLYLDQVDLFAEIARSPWFTKENGEFEVHRFTRGQPLGLGPSFFAFGLSHNALLEELCYKNGIDPTLYAILGDDIVIADDRLANLYRRELEVLGCKIAKEKSIVSNKVAEFAGKLIFAKDVTPQFKWRGISDANFVDFVRQVGPGAKLLLSKKQWNVIDQIMTIPEFLGGLGWNPHGLSLEIRMEDPLARFLTERSVVSLLSYKRVDRPLIEFASDPRLLELRISNHLDDSEILLPTREVGLPPWGHKDLWRQWSELLDQHRVLPLEIKQFEDANLHSAVLRRFYVPSEKMNSDPTSKEKVAWFDIMRYFERSQSRLKTVAEYND